MMLFLPALAVCGGLALIFRLVTMPDAAVAQIDIEDAPDPRMAVRQMELQKSATERFVGPAVDWVTERFRKVTPVSRIESVNHKLVLAGMEDSNWTGEAVLGIKMVLTFIGGILGLAILSAGLSTGNLVKAGVAVAVGYLIPETLLTRRVDDRQKQIQNTLPDFIDQITVSVEAGLGFDGAMQRAGEEGKGVFADELLKVVNDLQLGMSRDEALEALLYRTSVPDLRQFVLSIRQATRYGLPIARVLRVQSNEMREKRRARAEEKAMQIPVKITFPLVFFILPALFIVIIGPAGLQMAGGL